MLESFDISSWTGPFAAEMRGHAQRALEQGAVLYFPNLPFVLRNSETEFRDARLSDGKAKNISLDSTTGKLQGTSAKGDKAQRLAAMMERFGAGATAFVRDLLPNYAKVERARTSYRPVEVKGRAYSVLQDDRLLHIDAFPSRPMGDGRRILRFFANITPHRADGGGARRWHVGEPFEDFARNFAPRLTPHTPGKSWLWDKLGVTRGRRSAYDEMMLSLHDAAKLDAGFQANSPQEDVRFPPGSCWLVYPDQVVHAAVGGPFALEQTFPLGIDQMAEPERSPLRVLERLSGKT